MDIRLTAAVIAAKTIKALCRIFKHNGTSLPGKIALKIDPKILEKLAKDTTIIMVTGTNGKTTTTGMISEILNNAGKKFIVNKSGANLVRGVVTTFIESSSIFGRCFFDLALLEVDEAALAKLADLLQPDILIVNNFFRDQLDRYGEVRTVVGKVSSAISKSPKAHLILNADDSFCASLGKDFTNEATYFGIEPGAIQGFNHKNVSDRNVSTGSYCIYCQGKYDFSYRVLGHLGGFKCSSCGFKRPKAQVCCAAIEKLDTNSTKAAFEIEGKPYMVELSVPGLYNVYNALGAMTCCYKMGIPTETVIDTLKYFDGCFGRMEVINTPENKRLVLILAKNPTGFNQILNYLSLNNKKVNVSFIINNRIQDGVDVSWLWDVDFEKLNDFKSGLNDIYTSGMRAEDMALRLKYAGIDEEKIHIQKDYNNLIQECLNSISAGDTFYIVETYTAMMDLRKILKKKYGLKEIWQ